MAFGDADNRPKAHQRQNVALDVDAGRDLDQFETFRGQPEHASLGHIENRLPVACGQLARERDLIDLVDEFRRFAFAEDLELTIHDRCLEAAGGERACENQLGARSARC